MQKDTYIKYDNDKRIYFLEKHPDIYQGKIILLYGETNSGKTTVLLEILYLLRTRMAIPIIFSPTNYADNAFDDIIPQECIYNDVNIEKLQDIWEIQEERAVIYNTANDMGILMSLFDKIANNHEKNKARTVINDTQSALKDMDNSTLDRITIKYEKQIIIAGRDKYLTKIFKNQIKINKNRLLNMNLENDEKIAIEYIDFNPNIILIFDDCMSTAKKWDKDEIVKKLFYQGRRYYITQIYTLQDDHGIPPDLRKNAMFSIFTSQNLASMYFETKSNGIARDEKKEAKKVIKAIFKEKRGAPKHHQKLVYDSTKADKFMYTIAELYDDFQVGSSYTRKYTDKLPKKNKVIRRKRNKMDLINY